MGNSLATAKPIKYLVQNIDIIKNSGTQLPGIINLLVCLEKRTNLGYASFIPTIKVIINPIPHKLKVNVESPKADKTPKRENTIIDIGKISTVLTLTVRFLP